MGRLSQMKKTMGSIPVPMDDNPVRMPPPDLYICDFLMYVLLATSGQQCS